MPLSRRQRDCSPGKQERQRQFTQQDCQNRQQEREWPSPTRRQRERKREHQPGEDVVAERDIGNEGNHAKHSRQRAAGQRASHSVSAQGVEPRQHVGAPKQGSDGTPAIGAPPCAGPCQHRGSHRHEGTRRHGEFAMFCRGCGMIGFPCSDARVDGAIQVHVGALATRGTFGDVAALRLIARVERENIPGAAQQCECKQRQRCPARQVGKRVSGQLHVGPRAARSNDMQARGANARPMK